MLPINQCNSCNNRGCKKEVFHNPLMGQLPCKVRVEPSAFKARFIQACLYHEAVERGAIIHASQLSALRNHLPEMKRKVRG
jgi:hypothetical protein